MIVRSLVIFEVEYRAYISVCPSRVLRNNVRGSDRNNTSLFKYNFWNTAKIPKRTSIYLGIFIRKLAI